MLFDLATVKVFRFDPVTDTTPRYDIFNDLPYKDHSVLDILQIIYENHDSTLSFRRFCTKGLCGACAMVVNGRPVMACHAPAEKVMVIDPHPKFEILRDLAVKFDWIRAGYDPGLESEASKFTRINVNPEKCVNCRDCVNICPVGVWQVDQNTKKVIPTDPKSCLGPSCRQCSDSCWMEAISIIR